MEGENELTNEDDMRRHALEFYQNLFGREHRQNIKRNRGFWQEDEKVSVEENLNVEADFLEDDVKKAIYDSYAEGAPGPDGFSFLFYHKFWGVIKQDFMPLFKGFK
jgi:hypothetical protein